MALQFFDSPFHVVHDPETASKMAVKMDLSIFITDCIKKMGLKQNEAAERLNIAQSRVSELATGKIGRFTIDAMMDMLDKLGFRIQFSLPGEVGGDGPRIVIAPAPTAADKCLIANSGSSPYCKTTLRSSLVRLSLILRILLVSCVSIPVLAATTQSTNTLPTRPGVTERFMLITPDHPVASLILFSGGDGQLNINERGDIRTGKNNFLVRTRDQWAAQGFQVAVVDIPSDGVERDSYRYAQDIRSVAEFLKKKSNIPVWLVGTSRGTTSAASVSVKFAADNLFNGVVLTSSILDGEGSVTAFDLSRIKVPVLVVHHRNDGCPVTPYPLAPELLGRLSSASAKELITVEGGDDSGKPCEAMAHHGYNGVESVVVQKASDWIKAHLAN